MNDEEKMLLMLERVRDFEIRQRTDASLKNKAITLGGYERGLGFHIGEIEALCKEMEEDGLIRLGKQYMGPDSVRQRDVKTTSSGRRYISAVDDSEISRVKLVHSAQRTGAAKTKLSPLSKSVVLSSAALLDSIAEYREQLRGNNFLGTEHPEHVSQLLEFLDWLYPSIQELILRIPNSNNSQSIANEKEVTSWKEQYWSKIEEEFLKYTSPESVAKATVPAGIVLTTSSVGLLLGVGTVLGAAAGASAGAYIGNTLVGHAKPKEISEKITKSLEADDIVSD